jgi:hypothetical protein
MRLCREVTAPNSALEHEEILSSPTEGVLSTASRQIQAREEVSFDSAYLREDGQGKAVEASPWTCIAHREISPDWNGRKSVWIPSFESTGLLMHIPRGCSR